MVIKGAKRGTITQMEVKSNSYKCETYCLFHWLEEDGLPERASVSADPERYGV